MNSRLHAIAQWRVPRGLVVAACFAGLVLPAAVARASNLWFSGGLWIHQHTLTYSLSNGIDESQAMWDAARAAQIEWNQDTMLAVPSAPHDNSIDTINFMYSGAH